MIVPSVSMKTSTASGQKLWRAAAVTVVCSALLCGCGSPPAFYQSGLNSKDYNDLAKRSFPTGGKASGEAPPIPQMQPVLAAPVAPSLQQRLVSIDVEDPNIPLRDVLMELARKADIDIDMDPAIQGGVMFRAEDRPLGEVVDRICEMGNLLCTFKDNVLVVKVDRMYNEIYKIDAINVSRDAASTISTSTDVTSSVGTSTTGNNTSTSQVDAKSVSNLWSEVSANVGEILYNSSPMHQPVTSNLKPGSQGKTAPEAAAAVSHPAPAQPAQTAAGGSGQAATGNGQSAAGTAAAGQGASAASSLNQAQQIAQTTASAVAQTTAASAGKSEGGASADASKDTGAATPVSQDQMSKLGSFSINKQAGLISVFGTSRQQKLVKEYLDKVETRISSQVLIEAKIIEVSLAKEYKSGINWSALVTSGSTSAVGAAPLGTTGTTSTLPNSLPGNMGTVTPLSGVTPSSDMMTLGLKAPNFSVLLDFVQQYGKTRTLSSPRLTVMNNQTAVLKVAENAVYFTLMVTPGSTSTTGVTTQPTYSSTLHTVPLGVVMTVQPSIDLDRDQVTLNLRPTVTREVGTVNDPAVTLTAEGLSSSASVTSPVPVVDVREMDSMVTVPSGDIVVMGGLMQETVSGTDTGVPGLNDVPVLSTATQTTDNQTNVSELVVLLRATVVHGRDSVHPADKDLYQRYVHDPRPVAF